MLGKLDIHVEKNKTKHLSPYIRSNLTGTKDLNLRPKTMKLLEENIGFTTFQDFSLDKDFLIRTAKIKSD